MGLEGALGRRVTVGLLLALCSAVTSISTKEILRSFPFPVTIAAVQQLLSAALGRLGIASWQTATSGASPLFDAQIAPVVTAMVISLVAYRWSLMHASVSFTCIVKTLAPLFTILFSFAVEGQPTTAARCASVVPVVLGVALTSATEVEFSSVGALAALVATASQALQMVLAKRLLSRGVWSKPELFYRIALSGFCLLLGLSLLVEAQPIRDELRAPAALSDGASRRGVWRPAGWVLVNGICYFVNQLRARARSVPGKEAGTEPTSDGRYTGLSVLDAMDTPLSHALANVLKRAVVATPLHVFGAALSIFGALAYQQVVSLGGRWAAASLRSSGYAPVALSEEADALEAPPAEEARLGEGRRRGEPHPADGAEDGG
ncbi:hypothetical protein EMIHUDRAFT_461783 [Emiliania huxleyi CCMP1516]|uniref:Sugar phosphate transporter domain-containing protein n=2 Tax=Emiliania huxleyi TaxID=2903 RepID=A0A0D3IE73_EMIH1|nr:hypothetical protein EMIHUDRAFT_461783 [Emiliania huxleyi CCMP1516]EOD09558.1 hypothetical protein EMIHUDRAFT_461783 [Emiliania huxleyi CCMP1516]|eukprot:XP_005761987.1 hypothetical protein EMIHUDRAFT_461783 [Emiliania huxleyi CCMP1516]